jgi:hypothetical protein
MRREDKERVWKETLANWPDCIIPGCPNKCCLALHSPRCYPHSMEHGKDLVNEAVEDVKEFKKLYRGLYNA